MNGFCAAVKGIRHITHFRALRRGWPALLLLGALGQASAQPQPLVDHPVYPTALYAFNGLQHASEDLNGDGFPDLVGFRDAAIQVRFNNGNGGFGPAAAVTSFSPDSIALGDLDGNGWKDILLAFDSRNAQVIFNNGDGTFSSPQTTNLPSARVALIAHFDGTSGPRLPDVAITDGAYVTIYANNGDGTYTQLDRHYLSSSVTDLVVDRDSPALAQDLYVLRRGDLYRLDNDGTGDFTIANITPVSEDIISVEAGDLDFQIGTDFGLVTSSGLYVALSDGLGGLVLSAPYPLGSSPRGIALGDLDGSGRPWDVAVADRSPGSITTFLNDGAGNLVSPASYPADANTDDVIVRDLDGDGAAEVLARTGDVTVFGNAGDGSQLIIPEAYPTTGIRTDIAVDDWNQDGHPDVAVSVRFPTEGVGLFFSDEDGSLLPQVDIDVGGRITDVASGDFNLDGAPDLVLVNRSSLPNQLKVLLNLGGGTFSAPSVFAVGSTSTIDFGPGGSHGPAVGDFSGDGLPDIAIANLSNDTVSVMVNQGDGGFARNNIDVFNRPSYLAAGDFNGDGRLDLAVTTRDLPGQVRVLINDSDFSGLAFVNGPLLTLGSFPPSGLASGDLNGDGHDDLVSANWEEDVVRVLLAEPAGGFAPFLEYPVAQEPAYPAVGDANGDGALDLYVAHTDTNMDTLGVLLNSGDGSFLAEQRYHTGPIFGLALEANLGHVPASPRVAVLNETAGDETIAWLRNSTSCTDPSCLAVQPLVRCIHDPIYSADPQQTYTILVEAFDQDGLELEVDELEVWLDSDLAAPQKQVPASQATTLQVSPGGPFTYGCLARTAAGAAFSGWKAAGVTESEVDERAIPLLLHAGSRAEKIDVVFIPNLQEYTSFDDPEFLDDLYLLIRNGYWSMPWFLEFQQYFNFWIATDYGVTGPDPAEEDPAREFCLREGPPNWEEDYLFADVGALVHRAPCRDRASRSQRLFTVEAELDRLQVVIHETGHAPFGFADEYCCNSRYYSNPPFANLHDTEQDCMDEATARGFDPADCRLLESSKNDTKAWLFEPNYNDFDPEPGDWMQQQGCATWGTHAACGTRLSPDYVFTGSDPNGNLTCSRPMESFQVDVDNGGTCPWNLGDNQACIWLCRAAGGTSWEQSRGWLDRYGLGPSELDRAFWFLGQCDGGSC